MYVGRDESYSGMKVTKVLPCEIVFYLLLCRYFALLKLLTTLFFMLETIFMFGLLFENLKIIFKSF